MQVKQLNRADSETYASLIREVYFLRAGIKGMAAKHDDLVRDLRKAIDAGTELADGVIALTAEIDRLKLGKG